MQPKALEIYRTGDGDWVLTDTETETKKIVKVFEAGSEWDMVRFVHSYFALSVIDYTTVEEAPTQQDPILRKF